MKTPAPPGRLSRDDVAAIAFPKPKSKTLSINAKINFLTFETSFLKRIKDLEFFSQGLRPANQDLKT
jgi:hypothetical protein